MCEEPGKIIARVDVKADDNIQAGKRVHVKLGTQMTEEHLSPAAAQAAPTACPAAPDADCQQ